MVKVINGSKFLAQTGAHEPPIAPAWKQSEPGACEPFTFHAELSI